MERLRRLRADISHHDSAHRFSKDLGVDMYIGKGVFTSANTVEVGWLCHRFARCMQPKDTTKECTGAEETLLTPRASKLARRRTREGLPSKRKKSRRIHPLLRARCLGFLSVIQGAR